MSVTSPPAAPLRAIRDRLRGRSHIVAGTDRAVLVLHDVTKVYPNG